MECGPMRLVIQAWRKGVPQGAQCLSAAHKSIQFLEEAASYFPQCKAPAVDLNEPDPRLGIAHALWSAARAIAAPDLTPMAAVAGAIADAVADELVQQSMTKIIVNNGGDIAVRLEASESLWAAIRPKVDRVDVSHYLRVDGSLPIGGICTSGLGGRSFTRGIASAVTALAQRAAVADAAATAIANAAYVDSPAVKRAPASSIDPNSDLDDLDVTIRVDTLSDEEIGLALDKALCYAEALASMGKIFGAVITVQERTVWTRRIDRIVER
ncbi:MAG: UPF0280 family protein [Desulfomonilaceae bacterium]